MRALGVCAIYLIGSAPLTDSGRHPAVANEAKTVIVTQDANDGVIAMRLSDQIQVRLRVQLGTGFSWSAALPKPTMLRLANEQIESFGRDTPGAEQTQVFTFVATACGTEPLRFIYRQPWLPDAPSKYFTVTVTVTP